ncbi:MAG: hypothetical protein JO204_15810 [Alphaproteobacteria bacterium]|nr:hypothetical protein [Alphaproteobacteria bacterium]
MDVKRIAVAALLIAGAAAPGFAQAPNQANPPGQPGANAVSQPTLSPSSDAAHNPLVNPSAAGTQRRWKGYGSSSGAVTEHRIGSDNSARHYGPGDAGSVTPGGGMPLAAPSASPGAAHATTAAAARDRLKELGYSRISQLKQSGQSGWEALARRNNRAVRVTLDPEGSVTGEQPAGHTRSD